MVYLYKLGTLYQFSIKELSIGLSLFALSNGLSRPLFGYLMDKYGFIKSALGSILLIGFGALMGLLNQGHLIYLYYLSFSLFWFNLGAFLALMPQVIKTYYGFNRYASYYGVLFTAYGVAAIFGHLISGVVMNFVSHTSLLYTAILLVCMAALIVLWQLSKRLKQCSLQDLLND